MDDQPLAVTTPEGPLPVAVPDVHCHLTHAAFAHDLDAVLARASVAGVGPMITMGETHADNRAVLALVAAHPGVCAGLGHFPDRLDLDEWAHTEALLEAHRDAVTALGEVGLDHWLVQDADARAAQHALLRRIVQASLRLDLPLSVHSRSAGHHAIALLADAGARRVCLHAFDGKPSRISPALEAGYYFSVPPSVVRSPQKQKLVRALPLDRLLLESDAPVLGADATARNEPAGVALAAVAVARLKDVSLEAVCRAARDNAVALFGPVAGPGGSQCARR